MLGAFGHPICVELLLPLSDPIAGDTDWWTALMWAAPSGNEKSVELLLPHSDLTATNRSGLTALDIAQVHNQQTRAQQIRRHVAEEEALKATGAVVQAEGLDIRHEPRVSADSGVRITLPMTQADQYHPRRTSALISVGGIVAYQSATGSCGQQVRLAFLIITDTSLGRILDFKLHTVGYYLHRVTFSRLGRHGVSFVPT